MFCLYHGGSSIVLFCLFALTYACLRFGPFLQKKNQREHLPGIPKRQTVVDILLDITLRDQKKTFAVRAVFLVLILTKS